MNVTTTVNVGYLDVTVELTPEQIAAAVIEDSNDLDPRQRLIVTLNRVIKFFDVVPDSLITSLAPEGRVKIHAYFLKLAERFAPSGQASAVESTSEV
jgi:hypothetical protein